MYAYKLKSSVPNIGDPLNLMAISAVALGGTLMSGGKGSVLRTLVGVITVIAISSGMNMAGVDALWKDITYGVVLIVAIIINSEKGIRDLVVK
jgi:ribose/xylose/arabinose/galactoside ABC-type transport system permease subunit